MRVSRTCTEIPARDEDRHQRGESQSRPLKEFRESPAYVLVGDPGAGKTTSFQDECAALGEQAFLVTARDFLTFDPQNHPEWRGRTLFIDGLDEIRAGTSDVLTPFHQIRSKLDALVKPRFRLSCREADWLGENDRKHLASVAPDSQVKVLRLDPLTDADIASILDARPDIEDARAFIEAARGRSVEGLLANPQTLRMLADVVAGGAGWPESRMETFEMACRQMVREHNEERQAAQESGGSLSPGKLLDAAGRLCALQLISGRAGYTLRGEPDEEYPALDQCDYDSPEALRSALFTKLFTAATSGNLSTPVHRHLAEFLGGRHLAAVIQNELPARRVISMMTGEDDTVVTEMRGLSAWLAAHSRDARADLIERDPIGVGLYGDIGEFSLNEKRALLDSLKREGARLDSVWRSAAAFGALATSEMEADLREVLRDNDRTRDHQAFTDFVLRFLAEGTPLPDLGVLLIAIIRDDTRWPRVNTSALNAFIHNCPDGQDKADELRSLLADIRAERVSDTDKELLGILLWELYPRDLSPPQVWDIYFETSHRESFFGMYSWFLSSGLLEKSSEDQVAELLDTLRERLVEWRQALKGSGSLEQLPVRLLARGLQAHGVQLATERLYGWLDLGFRNSLDDSPIGDKEDIQEIRSWMEDHPEIQKAVILEGLECCPDSEDFWQQAFNVAARWYGANPPSEFGLWYLEQAVSMADKKPLVAEHLLDMAYQAHRNHAGDANLSLEVLQARTRRKACLRKRLDQLLSPSPVGERHLQYQEKRRRVQEEEQHQWIEHVRSNKAALLGNQAPPRLLYHMANWYFSGQKVIEERLRGDRDLIDAVLQGLRRTIDREDVPDQEEILRLREQDELHFLGPAFLAGVAEAEKTTDVSQWHDDRLRKAIAFHYSSDISNREPQWYRRLLTERPEIVAEVQVQFAVSGFRCGRERIDKAGALAYDPDYDQVAKHASLPLLRAFPTRCKLKQMESLHYLLKAAIQHSDGRSFQELIDTKLSRKSMNDAHRVSWLAAGIVVAPPVYADELRDFVKGKEARTRHLMGFFDNPVPEQFLVAELGNPILELLIGLLGRYALPDPGGHAEVWRGGPETRISHFVRGLIQRLAASPAADASTALADLLADPALSGWHDVLSRAQDEQGVIRRDAGYRHPDIAQVCQTLNGGTPANAGDLAALLMDLLQKLREEIRKSDADVWRQYWNVDSDGRPVEPRPESSCRDTLLQALRGRLPDGISAGREGQHPNEKRDDIWVAGQDFRVPLEVKKNSNRRLWSALRSQLIAQYTSTLGCDGYGIYLVFWFGAPPATAEELQDRLQATLSPEEARKISVCVIDVRRPQSTG